METRYLWILEIIWWVGSLLLAFMIVLPYFSDLIVQVPFLVPNIILTVVLIQCLRWTFMLRQSILSRHKWVVYFASFAFIPISLYALRHYTITRQFFENSDWIHSFSYLMSVSQKSELSSYILMEFTFISVSAFIAGFAFSGRMVVASWRIINKRQRI